MQNSFSEVITVTEVEANHLARVISCHRRDFTTGEDQAHRVSKRSILTDEKDPLSLKIAAKRKTQNYSKWSL